MFKLIFRKLISIFMVFNSLTFLFGLTANATNQSQSDALKKQLESAQSVYEQAKRDYQSSVKKKTASTKKIKELNTSISKLEGRISDKNMNSYYSEWQQALQNITDMESKCNTLKKQIENTLTEYNKGSFGFFEYVGANDALQALKNCKYASYTHQGSMSDATNLDNMKSSFDYIRRCNTLRQQAKKDPEDGGKLGVLKVTDYMMATAQADANYSLTHIEHAKQFPVGENLAWGNRDPFTAWYDEEKEEYDFGVTEYSSIGHYLNIVTSGYGITGFAVAQGGTYGIEYGQTFDWSTNDNEGMSVDDYEKRFMKYYNIVTAGYQKLKPSYDTAKNELLTEQINAEICQGKYNSEKSEQESLKQQLNDKKANLSSEQNILAQVTELIPQQKEVMQQKEKAYLSAQKNYNDAKMTKQKEKSPKNQSQTSKAESSQQVSEKSKDVSEDKIDSVVNAPVSTDSSAEKNPNSEISENSINQDTAMSVFDNNDNQPSFYIIPIIVVIGVILVVLGVIVIAKKKLKSK